MAPINSYKSNPLYPDRYTDGSNWIKVLPIPGRALQTSELIEMQSIFQGQLRMALSSTYRDGSPISGLRVIGGEGSTYKVTSGLFYIQGVVLRVEGVDSITPGTTKTLYVVVDEQVITELDDPRLRDPLRGDYGLEGAHRLVWTAKVGTEPGFSSYPIATITEGGQVVQRNAAPPDGCLEILARYTRDRMGVAFLLQGLHVSYGGSKQTVTSPLSSYKREEVDRLSGEVREYSSLLASTGGELSRVRLELEVAIVAATSSPSAPNRFLVDTKRKRVQELEVIMASLSSEVGSLNAQLSSMSSTLPLRETLNVSPGVAYIEGYRIEKVTPTIIEIPHATTVEEVEAAKFTYLSSPATSSRTLLPSGLYTDGGQISITFTGIPYQLGYITVTANYSWTTTTRPLHDLVEAFQKGLCSSYSSPASLPPTTLKEALLRVVALQLLGPSSLLFTSQYRDSLIGLSISSNRYEMDVEDAYLMAPTSSLNTYELGRKPVADIQRVVADLEATLIPITRKGSRDELGDDTVFSIKEVLQGTTKYVEGRDYSLYGQGWIEWRPQVGPALGTTYYVTYLYTQPLTKGTDYRLVGDNVELTNNTRRPAPGYTFTVDYSYSLPQAGRVYMDRDSVIGYTLSPPSVDPQAPQEALGTLSLCTFTLLRDRVVVSNLAVPRLSVADLAALVRQYRQGDSINYLPLATWGEGSTVSITPSWITTPTRYLNIPIKYQGGGQLQGGVTPGGSRHITMPHASSLYLEQGRVTGTKTLMPRPTPQVYLLPQVITHTAGTGQYIQPCGGGSGQAPWSSYTPTDKPTVTTSVLVTAIGLDSTTVYSIIHAGQPVPYTVVVGDNTSSGVRPLGGKVEVYISINSMPPGSYRVELRPLGVAISTAAATLSLVHPTYRQLGIDRSPLPDALAISSSLPPISQTVMPPSDMYISAIGIRFRYVEQGAALWVTIETLDTVSLGLHGAPDASGGTAKVLGKGVVVSPQVSIRGSEVTVVELDYPIYLRGGNSYRLCFYVQGGQVDIYTATLGEVDLLDGSYIGGQLLHLGEASVSEDGITVMPLPQVDVSHSLYAARYLIDPVLVYLGTYGLPDLLTPLTAFCINGDDLNPPGTSILYEYKGSDSVWRPCSRGDIACITSTSTIELRATMYSSKTSVTPCMMLEGVTVTLYSNSETGVLVGSTSSPHTKARLSYLKAGSSGTLVPTVSVVGGTSSRMSLVSAVPEGDNVRYTYEAHFPSVNSRSEYQLALWDRPLVREVVYEGLL